MSTGQKNGIDLLNLVSHPDLKRAKEKVPDA